MIFKSVCHYQNNYCFVPILAKFLTISLQVLAIKLNKMTQFKHCSDMHQQPLASASKDMTDVAVLPLLNTIYTAICTLMHHKMMHFNKKERDFASAR